MATPVCDPCTIAAPESFDDCGKPVVAPIPASSNDRAANQSVLNRALENQFVMFLDVPDAVRLGEGMVRDCNVGSIEKLQLNVYGTMAPQISIAATPLRFGGQQMNLSSGFRDVEQNISLNYKVDNTYTNYWILWQWMEILSSAKYGGVGKDSRIPGPSRWMPPKDYQTTLTLRAFDGFRTPRIEWKYTGAFLTQLGSLAYNYQTGGELNSSFTFTFSQLECTLL